MIQRDIYDLLTAIPIVARRDCNLSCWERVCALLVSEDNFFSTVITCFESDSTNKNDARTNIPTRRRLTILACFEVFTARVIVIININVGKNNIVY